MAKKKTRVLLPGGIQGLVHDLQNGTSTFSQRPIVDTVVDEPDDLPSAADPAPAAPVGSAAEETLRPATAHEQASQGEQQGPEASDSRADDSADASSARMSASSKPAAVDASGTQTERVGESNPAAAPAAQPARTTMVEPADTGSDTNARGRKPKENTMKEYHIVKDDSTDSWELFIDMAKQYKTGGGKLATIYIDETLKSVLDRMKYAGPDKLSTSAILSSIVARFIYDHEDDIRKALFSGNLI